MMKKVLLNDGHFIPALGLGVFESAAGITTQNAVLSALKAGYNHVDTAAIYKNEQDVGIAVAKSGIDRESIFVTSKLWNDDQGYDSAIKACESSLAKLNFKYLDLYLLHAPVVGKRLDSWRALESLKERGLVRSIGVSNFGVHHLKELLKVCKIRPAVNQIEVHPFLIRKEIVDFCQSEGIVVEAYSPLTRGKRLADPKLKAVADRYNCTTAQLLVNWGLQHGFVSLPKSVHEERLKENAVSVNISDEDMALLDSFDENFVTCWNPIEWE